MIQGRQKNQLRGMRKCESWRSEASISISRAAKRGGGFKRGFSRSGLVLPSLSFFLTFPTFRDLPDLSGDGPAIFPIDPFSSFSAC